MVFDAEREIWLLISFSGVFREHLDNVRCLSLFNALCSRAEDVAHVALGITAAAANSDLIHG